MVHTTQLWSGTTAGSKRTHGSRTINHVSGRRYAIPLCDTMMTMERPTLGVVTVEDKPYCKRCRNLLMNELEAIIQQAAPGMQFVQWVFQQAVATNLISAAESPVLALLEPS